MTQVQWHPIFVKAMQMELYDYREHLEYRQEHQLTSAPLQIDLLIIKKPRELTIDKNIARIFRTDNILEYKSPEDYLSVKDFWKVSAYANLYAAITPGVDLADVTLTFVEDRHPQKLLDYLVNTRGYTAKEPTPGIYHITGDYLPIQIIESKKLTEAENLWLRSLRNKALQNSTLSAISKEGKKFGSDINIDDYINHILRMNQEKLKEADKMGWRDTMVEILEEDGVITQLQEKGIEKTARNLLARNMPLEEIAEVTELPLEKIRALAVA
jgi:hypothetical protein